MDDATLLSHDLQHVSDFAKSTRDLIQASEVTINAIEKETKSTVEQQTKFEKLILDKRLLQEDVRNIIGDVEDYVQRFASRAERSINERQ